LLYSDQTKISLRIWTEAIFYAPKLGDLFENSMTDMNFLTLWYVIEGRKRNSTMFLKQMSNFYWLRAYF
jgi:hypothetical protein